MGWYYKILNENGEVIGICTTTSEQLPVVPDNYVEITYEEYLEVCEQLGIYPR